MQLTPRDRRMLQILGVVAGLSVAYFLFTNVLGGGGDEIAQPTGSSGVVLPTTSPTLTASPSTDETLPPVVLAGARDPFSIPAGLVTTAPVGATGGTTSGTTSGTTTVTGTTTTTTSTFTIPGGSTSTTTTTSTSTSTTTSTSTSTTTTSPGGNGDGDGGNPPTDEVTIGGHDLKLLSVDGKHGRVEIRVDRRLYTVEEGALFASNFKLVKIDGRCARFLFGDQSFTLCLPQP